MNVKKLGAAAALLLALGAMPLLACKGGGAGCWYGEKPRMMDGNGSYACDGKGPGRGMGPNACGTGQGQMEKDLFTGRVYRALDNMELPPEQWVKIGRAFADYRMAKAEHRESQPMEGFGEKAFDAKAFASALENHHQERWAMKGALMEKIHAALTPAQRTEFARMWKITPAGGYGRGMGMGSGACDGSGPGACR